MTFDALFLQRFIIFLLIAFIFLSIIKKAGKFACFCISILCIMHMGHYLSTTSLNDKIPLDQIFKYDVVKSITSIWDETDKEALKQNTEKVINDTWDATDDILQSTEDIINKYKEEQNSSGDNSENVEMNEEINLEERLPQI